jgi:hypothetical protein
MGRYNGAVPDSLNLGAGWWVIVPAGWVGGGVGREVVESVCPEAVVPVRREAVVSVGRERAVSVDREAIVPVRRGAGVSVGLSVVASADRAEVVSAGVKCLVLSADVGFDVVAITGDMAVVDWETAVSGAVGAVGGGGAAATAGLSLSVRSMA